MPIIVMATDLGLGLAEEHERIGRVGQTEQLGDDDLPDTSVHQGAHSVIVTLATV